ncbi:RNA polymerase sigma-70 factor [Alistipes sp.]|uniref:RNA polymerase sigma-70 factor n=1 Tax=Alistipes sp. TaxID=1872444 RepID=UPI003A8C3C0E
MTPPTDETLLQNLIQGDSRAFDALYTRYVPRVEAFACCMLKDRSEAEDLAHDLFLKLWESRESLQQVRSVRNYLFRMTKNAVFDRFEHKAVDARYRQSAAPKDLREIVSNDLVEQIDRQELLLLIDMAIEKMPPQRRNVFRMSRFEGVSYQEIALRLGISQKTVEYHIHEALAELRKLILILAVFIEIGKGL